MKDMFDRLFEDALGLDAFFGRSPEPPESIPLRILGLSALPRNRAALESAFRDRAKQTHPDLVDGDAIGWGIAGRSVEFQEVKWARDVLRAKVREPVTDSDADAGVPIPIRNESPATLRQWRGVAPSDNGYTYALAQQIAQELRDRPADSWVWVQRPVTEDEWVNQERRHISARARRDALLCENCGRDLDPAETVVRVRYHFDPECLECAGKSGSGVEPQPCDGCGRPTKDFRFRRHVFDWETGLSGKRSFCCERCQSAFYRRRQQQRRAEERAEAGPRRCEACEEILDGQRYDARYCSGACRQRAYRSRRKP